MRLFPKLAVLLTLFSIFSIALVGYLAFENSRRALENETVNHLISTNKSKELLPYFVLGKTRTFVQNVYYSMSVLQPVMTVASPLKDRDGKVIAVVAGRFDLTVLSEIMAQYSPMKQTQDSYLVNTFNFFVTEPRFGTGYALKKSVHTEGVTECLKRHWLAASAPGPSSGPWAGW